MGSIPYKLWAGLRQRLWYIVALALPLTRYSLVATNLANCYKQIGCIQGPEFSGYGSALTCKDGNRQRLYETAHPCSGTGGLCRLFRRGTPGCSGTSVRST